MSPNRALSRTGRSWKAIPSSSWKGWPSAAYANGANAAYIYLRGEFWQVAARLDEKIADLEKAGFLGGTLFGTEYSCTSSPILARVRTSAGRKRPYWNR